MGSRVEQYAKLYLQNEIKAIENSERISETKELDTFEKAIIYKYSTDGYISVNEQLRGSNGKNISELGLLLEEVLKKLPNYRGLVFRRNFRVLGITKEHGYTLITLEEE